MTLKGHLFIPSRPSGVISPSRFIFSLSKTLICSFSIKQPQRSPYIPSSCVICARWPITGSHLFIVSYKRLLTAIFLRAFPAWCSLVRFTQSSITGVITTFKTHLNLLTLRQKTRRWCRVKSPHWSVTCQRGCCVLCLTVGYAMNSGVTVVTSDSTVMD